jgi:hypothetical protein
LANLDTAYEAWELQQQKLADVDMARKTRADERIKAHMALNGAYARWESEKSAKAEDELARKVRIAQEASDLVDRLREVEAQAKARLAKAEGANVKRAEREAQEAEDQRVAAESAAAHSDKAVERARVNAEQEARNSLRQEQEAITARYQSAENADALAKGVTEVEPYTGWTSAVVNVRIGPGPSYDKVGELAAHTEVRVTGVSGAFYRVSDGTYIPSRYVTDSPTAEDGEEDAAAEHSPYAWQTYVANVDGQEAVDSCMGGLTYSPAISNAMGRKYYPIHVHCSGVPILSLKNGDLVYIESVGVYRVVDSKDVHKKDTIEVVKDVKGDIVLQTCYTHSDAMRVVGLDDV